MKVYKQRGERRIVLDGSGTLTLFRGPWAITVKSPIGVKTDPVTFKDFSYEQISSMGVFYNLYVCWVVFLFIFFPTRWAKSRKPTDGR